MKCDYKHHHRLVGRLATDVEGPDTPGIISHRLRLRDFWEGLQSRQQDDSGYTLSGYFGYWFNVHIIDGETVLEVELRAESSDSLIELIPRFLLLEPHRLSYWWAFDPLEVKFTSPQGEEGLEVFGRLMKQVWGHPKDDNFESPATMTVRVKSEFEPPEEEGCLGAIGYCDELEADQLRQSARLEEAIILARWGSKEARTTAARSARYPLVDRSLLDSDEFDDGRGEPRPGR